MIDTITRFIEGKKGRSSSAAAAAASASSSAAAAEKTYDEPESTSYARVRDAAAGEALPTLKIDFVRPAPAAPASARASVSNASAPAWKALFGGGGGEGEKTLTLPAVDVTLPDKAGLLSSLSRRVSDAVSAANDEAEFHKQTLRDGLTGALRSFRAKPEQAAPAAAMAAAAPLVIQPVPQTTIVPVISTSTIMPSYYTHKKPLFGKGAGALGGYGGYGKK
ncbi:MAG: hypothetical protein J3K34DRAFT_241262 [Monoraphidium minutum]|nr:MAG: hypothetical protein J3K34DRAFT_241262 [Monoraphidium minutum]